MIRLRPRMVVMLAPVVALFCGAGLTGLYWDSGIRGRLSPAPALGKSSEKETTGESPAFSTGDLRLLKDLEARRQELDRREEKVKFEEARLEVVKREIEKDLAKFSPGSKGTAGGAEMDPKKEEGDRFAQVAEMVGAMKPQQAAALIEEMDGASALKILGHMNRRKAAQVLSAIAPEKAAKLSQDLLQSPSGEPSSERGKKIR